MWGRMAQGGHAKQKEINITNQGMTNPVLWKQKQKQKTEFTNLKKKKELHKNGDTDDNLELPVHT